MCNTLLNFVQVYKLLTPKQALPIIAASLSTKDSPDMPDHTKFFLTRNLLRPANG